MMGWFIYHKTGQLKYSGIKVWTDTLYKTAGFNSG